MGVGRPDSDGRAAILRIHAEKMRASGRLSLGADANHRAAMGFTVVQFGAMMFDVVASALTLTLTLTLTQP